MSERRKNGLTEKEETTALALRAAGANISTIIKRLGRSYDAVSRLLRDKAGYEPTRTRIKPRDWTKSEHAKFKALVDRGISWPNVAAAMNMRSWAQARQTAKRLGLLIQRKHRNLANVAAGTRTCSECWKEKPQSEFWKGQSQCRYCRRDLNVMAQYGLAPGEYRAMMKRQRNVCAICKKPCPVYEHLTVDHDHITRKVRGLLCAPCNTAIGQFEENVGSLRSAKRYIATTVRIPTAVRATNLTRAERARRLRFGLERNQYQYLLEVQEHRCAICGVEPWRLVVDHDAATGRVRGLLCIGCNAGIGSLHHDVKRIDAVVRYLLRHA